MSTHRQLTADQQMAAGAEADLVRLSIGIEDPEDLIADLDVAQRAPPRGAGGGVAERSRERWGR